MEELDHVHLLVDAQERWEVSGLMGAVAGQFARACNRRKGRENAFWGEVLVRLPEPETTHRFC